MITASFDRPKIAVLPFKNLGSPDVEYFADGMTDEVSIRLAGISGIGVISRTSTMQYKRTDLALYEIAAELDADFVVEGAVRWDSPGGALGGRVRVTPQFIRVHGDSTIWASAYIPRAKTSAKRWFLRVNCRGPRIRDLCCYWG